MKRLPVALALLASLTLSCAPASDLPELEDADSGDAARALEADTIYVVTRQDFRKCAYPMCGGVFVKAVNKSKTTCLDGTKDAECYVADIDLAALELPEDQTIEVVSQARAGEVLLSGNIAPHSDQFPAQGRLATFKAWKNRVSAPVSGVAHFVEASGITCVTAPCPSLHARRLNSNVVKQVTDLDLSALSLTDDAAAAALSQAFESGVMFTGSIKNQGGKKTFRANQIFDLVQPAAPLCFADDDCGKGSHCDTSECLSTCPPDQICPAVCAGVCKAGPKPTPAVSCSGLCGSSAPDESCWCDDECSYWGDCCSDYYDVCE
jgi:hypothetical protein